jgi:hypothetical protein
LWSKQSFVKIYRITMRKNKKLALLQMTTLKKVSALILYRLCKTSIFLIKILVNQQNFTFMPFKEKSDLKLFKWNVKLLFFTAVMTFERLTFQNSIQYMKNDFFSNPEVRELIIRLTNLKKY